MSDIPIATSIDSTITLNDGTVMPMFGLGVWKTEPGDQTEQMVGFALENGYRMIDTAVYYKNEADVGRAVRNCGLKREDVFVVDKLWNDQHGYEKAKKAIQESVKKMGLDYIDMYLFHSPNGDKLVDTYRAMVEAKEQGLVRSIGVSNFGVQHIEGLLEAGLPLPAINQIQLHVWLQKTELVKWCRQKGITVMGYAPIAKARKMDDETVIEMSKKYGKSYAQLLIRWSVQSGFITIPKSSKKERIIENADMFSWEISTEDMKILNALPEFNCTFTWNPTEDPWKG